jgi:uncharacterized protein involved in cysteine biosynthesis
MGGDFFRGFVALGRALPFAFDDRRLMRLTLAPAALALGLTVLSAFAALHYGHALINHFHAGGVIGVLLWLALILAVAGATWLGWLLSCVVATAPFADAIAERAEALAGAAPLPARRLSAAVSQSLRGIGHALLSVAIYAAIAVPLFVLGLAVPVLTPATAVAGFLVTAFFLAHDLYDPMLSRRGFFFGQKWKALDERRGEALGLGVAVALASAVPLLGVLAVPLGTVAAARLYAPDAASSRSSVR